MPLVAIIILGLLAAGPVSAKVVTEELVYSHDHTTLKGYLAYDDALPERRPGVMVVHEWWGLNDFARQQTVKLAEGGFVALAVDMYGDGKVTRDPEIGRAHV